MLQLFEKLMEERGSFKSEQPIDSNMNLVGWRFLKVINDCSIPYVNKIFTASSDMWLSEFSLAMFYTGNCTIILVDERCHLAYSMDNYKDIIDKVDEIIFEFGKEMWKNVSFQDPNFGNDLATVTSYPSPDFYSPYVSASNNLDTTLSVSNQGTTSTKLHHKKINLWLVENYCPSDIMD